MSARAAALAEVVGRIVAVRAGHTVRVAIDGIDAAGKTTLAGELAALILGRGRPVIRASVDGFHNSRMVRYRRGQLSPEGYFHDSFNLPALISSLLAPLGPDGDGRYRSAVFDYRTDLPVEEEEKVAPPGAILLFDGIFLGRPELAAYFDWSIFVDITFDTCLANALERDRIHFGGEDEELPQRYATRYIPAQRYYLDRYHPRAQADIVMDNNDPAAPHLISYQPPATSP